MVFQPGPSDRRSQGNAALDLSSSVFGKRAELKEEKGPEVSGGADIYQVHLGSERIVHDLIKARRLDLVEKLESMGTGIEITPDAILSCQKIEGGQTYLVRLTHSCGTDTCFEISAKDGSERNIGMTYFPISADTPLNPSGWNRTGTSLSVDALLDLAFG